MGALVCCRGDGAVRARLVRKSSTGKVRALAKRAVVSISLTNAPLSFLAPAPSPSIVSSLAPA